MKFLDWLLGKKITEEQNIKTEEEKELAFEDRKKIIDQHVEYEINKKKSDEALERLEYEQLKIQISEYYPRVNEMIRVANYLMYSGIEIPLKFYYDRVRISFDDHRLIGFEKSNTNGEFRYISILERDKFIFRVDPIEELVYIEHIPKYSKPYWDTKKQFEIKNVHMSRFLSEFDDFEKLFYKYINELPR